MGAVEMWIIGGLVAAVGVLIQWWMKRIERDIAAAKAGAAAQADAMAKALKADIDGLGARLYAHELKVAADYVSGPRLTEALRPFAEQLGRLNDAQERIFARLDGKADKPGHD